MFNLTVELEDDTGAVVNGVVSAYLEADRSLVSRESTVGGSAVLDLNVAGLLILTVASDMFFATRAVVVPAEEGVGDVTLVGTAKTLIPPIGAAWCSVQGIFVDSFGQPRPVSVQARLLTGDTDIGETTVINRSGTVDAQPDGSVNINLLRGRSYAVNVRDAPLEELPSEYKIHVPDIPNATIYEVLYPYITGGSIEGAFAGDGEYILTVTLSDGRSLSENKDISPLIFAVEVEDAEAEIKGSEEKTILHVRNAGPAAVVRVRGNRRGTVDFPDDGTAHVSGDVFLSLG